MIIVFTRLYVILTCFLLWQNINGVPILQITFKPYENDYKERLERRLRKYGSLGKASLYSLIEHNIVTGIFASYAGFLGTSDIRGIITFGRRHSGNFVHVLFTPEITPIAMFHNTLHHWELDPKQEARMYKVEPAVNPKSKLVWDIKEVPLPENKIIDLETIIIFGNPKDFVFEDSEPPLTITPNMVLPPILVKKGIDVLHNSLYVLHIRHFFRTAQPIYQKQQDRFQMTPQP